MLRDNLDMENIAFRWGRNTYHSTYALVGPRAGHGFTTRLVHIEKNEYECEFDKAF